MRLFQTPHGKSIFIVWEIVSWNLRQPHVLLNRYSPEKDIKIERSRKMNSVTVTIKDKVEIMVNVVPVTKEDDRIHSYKVPLNDCFAHLEVQFRFFNLSPKVDGILGRTYRPDFENPAKPGVAMPVVGGEDNFRTSSLLSHDCKTCIFTGLSGSIKSETAHALLDCTRGASSGYGIICKKKWFFRKNSPNFSKKIKANKVEIQMCSPRLKSTAVVVGIINKKCS